MLAFIFGLLLTGVGFIGLTLLKTYEHVPPKELKRLARRGDEVAALIYKPVSYGVSLQILLWVKVVLALAGSVVVFSRILPGWLAFVLVAGLVWVGFIWIPTGKLTRTSIWLARRASPPLSWLLERLSPLVARTARFVRVRRPVIIHTGLYEKADLAELLTKQLAQPDNRIDAAEIDLLVHALSFGDKLVLDVLIPQRVVVSVNADEPIGPSVMAELHQSGHSRFPVYDGKHDNIVGILYLHDLVKTRRTGKIRDLMQTDLRYVHEDFTLFQTLQAFIRTKRHLFLVVNSFEELTGIVTIEDVLEQIVGQPIIDEFDQYDDLRAVATALAASEHIEHQKTDTEPPEVVK